MNQHKLIALGMLAGMSTFALVACGDDETTPSQTADTGVSDASDGSSDLDAAPPTDTTSDAAPDVTPDVVPDSTPEDGSSTPDVEEPSVCPGSISCFDERTGAPSIAVCRAGGFPEGTTCVIGDDDEACCVAPFACVTDQDCEDNREAEGFCADARFPCVCVEGGICVTELCSSSAECDEGEVCSGGICGSPPAGVDREARLLNRTEYVQPGTTLQAMGVAVSVDDPRLTDPFATLTYASSDADVATVDGDGVVTAADQQGETEVSVALDGGAFTDSVMVVNVGPDTSSLRVVIIDEATRQPIDGAVLTLIDGGGAAEQFTYAPEPFVFDSGFTGDFQAVHVFAPGYATVSVVGSVARHGHSSAAYAARGDRRGPRRVCLP